MFGVKKLLKSYLKALIVFCCLLVKLLSQHIMGTTSTPNIVQCFLSASISEVLIVFAFSIVKINKGICKTAYDPAVLPGVLLLW